MGRIGLVDHESFSFLLALSTTSTDWSGRSCSWSIFIFHRQRNRISEPASKIMNFENGAPRAVPEFEVRSESQIETVPSRLIGRDLMAFAIAFLSVQKPPHSRLSGMNALFEVICRVTWKKLQERILRPSK
jgi:hypothetical protein